MYKPRGKCLKFRHVRNTSSKKYPPRSFKSLSQKNKKESSSTTKRSNFRKFDDRVSINREHGKAVFPAFGFSAE